MIIDEIKEILKGIDEQETDTEDGWWETSTGAEFGARKLKELIIYLEYKTFKDRPDESI